MTGGMSYGLGSRTYTGFTSRLRHFHYLFPQLTMVSLSIVVLKSFALWKRDESYNKAARFWARIFAINFAMGVVTGIPMEFQFGTNWAAFSKSAGGIIGQTLAMEGVFSFFLESSFLGLFLYGEKRLGPKPPLALGLSCLSRLVAVRLLHHCHQCLDAASGRMRDRIGGRVATHERSGAAVESPGSCGRHPHSDRARRDGPVRAQAGGLVIC